MARFKLDSFWRVQLLDWLRPTIWRSTKTDFRGQDLPVPCPALLCIAGFYFAY